MAVAIIILLVIHQNLLRFLENKEERRKRKKRRKTRGKGAEERGKRGRKKGRKEKKKRRNTRKKEKEENLKKAVVKNYFSLLCLIAYLYLSLPTNYEKNSPFLRLLSQVVEVSAFPVLKKDFSRLFFELFKN